MSGVRKYDASSVAVASAMEGVRKHPGMYVGDVDGSGTLQCFAEVFQNSTDEMGEVGGGKMRVSVRGKTVTVADQGRGIPVEVHPKTGVSTLETVLTHIHAGGKSGEKTAYGGRTIGVHGVGVSAVNALSARMTAWSHRKGTWWRLDLARGVVTRKLHRADPPFRWPCGTIVQYELDETILAEPLPRRSLRHLCHIARHFHPIDIAYSDGERSAQLERRRPEDLLARLTEGLEVLAGPFDVSAGGVRLVASWTSAADCQVQAHVSGAPVGSGTHVRGLEEAVAEAFAGVLARDSKRVDATVGLRAVLDASVDQPSFSGQAKTTLRTPGARRQVLDAVTEPLRLFLRRNKDAARAVLEHAARIGAIDARSGELKELAKTAKSGGKFSFPKGFVAALNTPPEQREIYVVEGDSAKGCFTGDTRVLLEDGTDVTFADMVVGDRQFRGVGFDLITGATESFHFVEPRVTKHVTSLTEVTMSDGTVVRATHDHPWLCADGNYVASEELTPGTVLRVVDWLSPDRAGRKPRWGSGCE